MSKVLAFKLQRKPSHNPLEEMSRYFCLKCENDTFKLAATGEVFCSSCRAKIKDMAVKHG